MNIPILALDVETTVDHMNHLRVITLQREGSDPFIAYSFAEHGEEVPERIKELIESSRCISHNAAFDCSVLQRAGIFPKRIWCTGLSEQVISGGALSTHMPSYKNLVKKYFDIDLSKEEQISDWSQKLTESQIEYCLHDVKYLMPIYEKQKEHLVYTGAITHVELKHNLMRLWCLDLKNGYPINIEEARKLEVEAKALFRQGVMYFLETMPLETMLNKTEMKIEELKKELSPHIAWANNIGTGKSKVTKVQMFTDPNYLQELKNYFLKFPDSKFLKTMTDHHFVKAVAKHYGFQLEGGTDEKTLVEFMESNPESEEPLKHILSMRMANKIYATYVKNIIESAHKIGSEERVQFRQAWTTSTGRITLTPLAQCVKPDESNHPLQNRIQHIFVPPKGFKVLSLDFSSIESVATGTFYNDVMKVKMVAEGYDPYLKLAEAIFGQFEYNDPAQTKDLKKEFKMLRQACKAVELGKGYGMGKTKAYNSVMDICRKFGIPFDKTADEIQEDWESVYVGISEAQKNSSHIVAAHIGETLENANLAGSMTESSRAYIYKSGFESFTDPEVARQARIANEIRKRLLFANGDIVSTSSILGLRRDFPSHRDYNKIRVGAKQANITELFNFPIQSSSGEALWLSLLMIKKLFPSLTIGGAIHDSLLIFVPENGLPDFTLEELKQSIEKVMKQAFWVLFGQWIGISSEYMERGW